MARKPSTRCSCIGNLFQVGCVEPDTQDVTFWRNLKDLNDDKYSYCLRFVKKNHSHQCCLEDPFNPLSKVDRADYVAFILR